MDTGYHFIDRTEFVCVIVVLCSYMRQSIQLTE